MTNNDEYDMSRPFTPRPFFIPEVDEAEMAESIYESTRKNLLGESVPDRRIQRLDYEHNGQKFRAEVGEQDQGGEGTVMAIFGPSSPRNLYYVTTLDRGMLRGIPIMVGAGEVRKVYEFLDE
ncbi:hypothetical protein ACFVGV_06015 [Pseudarthrobacter scleromae]|uniref:hypothetical protein n=1 Tax=Pseudarthrobacter scleromae TaxID=158897 RepID=UPI0036381BA0